MVTIADTIRASLAEGKTNEQVLADVKTAHPNANTSAACVSYYRSKMKKAEAKENPYKEGSVSHAIHKALYPASGRPLYTVKGVKTFVGMEGHGYNASLYRDGKLVAFVIDDASGGPLQVEWKDHAAERLTVQTKDYKGSPWTVKMTPEEKMLHDHVSTMPPRTCEWTDSETGKPAVMTVTSDIFIEDLVNDALLLKDVARMTKGKVAFIKADGKLYTVKCEPNETNIAAIKAKHVGCVVLNGMSDLAVLAAVRAVA